MIFGSFDCTEALPGKTHCTTARIEPDSFCNPLNPLWDMSSIEVSASCTNDTVLFTIKNVGLDMLEPSSYVIIEDIVIHLGGDFELPTLGEELISVPAVAGATYQIQAMQSTGHPGSSMPTTGVEGCGDFNPDDFTLGIIAQFPQDEGDPFVAIHCQASVVDGELGSLIDDVDYRSSNADSSRTFLYVSPLGIGPENLIDTSARVEFLVNFRPEPGSQDSFYQVVISGQLPPEFDVTSLRPEVGSHPFEFSVEPSGAFRLNISSEEPLVFPPAFAGWGGFVQFSAQLKSGLSTGTQTCFSAQVNFNNQAPEFTNTRCLTVRKPVRYGFQSFNDCEAGLDSTYQTRVIDSIPAATFDSIVLTLTTTSGSTTQDSFPIAMSGDTIAGTVIQITDGQLIIRDTLLSEKGCDSIIVYNVTVTSVEENGLADQIQLFPNPASDWLAINVSKDLSFNRIEGLQLINLSGQVFPLQLQGTASASQGGIMVFDIRQLPRGIYVLRGRIDDNVWHKKMVIE